MRDSKTWGVSVGLVCMAALTVLTVIDNENYLTSIVAAAVFVLSFFVDRNTHVFALARYSAAAMFVIASASAFSRVETPFPLFFEIWGDMPRADTINVLVGIGLAALAMTLLKFPRPRSHTPAQPQANSPTA